MSRFKVQKARPNSTDVFAAAKSVTAIIAHVSDMLQFLPARAAASVVLVILETVQQIDSNKVACYKLARRSAKILVDLKVRMAGRWGTAPKALVENIQEYEKVLICIRDFMQELKKVNWMGRLLKKGSIEEALSDFHELLDEAERTFQMASLVEIHYTVGVLEKRNAEKDDYSRTLKCESRPEGEAPESAPPYAEGRAAIRVDPSSKPSIKEQLPIQTLPVAIDHEQTMLATENLDELQLQEELRELELFGFKRYHQTDLRLLCDPKFGRSNSFWKDTMVADVHGSRVLVKRYDKADANGKNNLKEWLYDLKILRNLHHPNLPQLTGYSDEKTPVPFILLANAKLRDPCTYLLRALRKMSISESAIAALKIYRDISMAALYVQRQLCLDERETQVFVADASYALDAETGKIIVGIPSLKDSAFRGFGYPLTESLLGRTLQILPGEKSLAKNRLSDVVDLQDKLAHVRALCRILLPRLDQSPELPDISESLLEDSEFDFGESSIPLSRIRRQAISAGMHEFAWHVAIHSCPHTFTVGDIGYISHDSGRVSLTDESRFDHFVKVGNIIEDTPDPNIENDSSDCLSIIREVDGMYGQWINGFHKSEKAWPFSLSEDVEGWPVSIGPGTEVEVHVRHTTRIASISRAWDHLLQKAMYAAVRSGIEPQELILITKSVSGQIYKLHDWSPARSTLFKHTTHSMHGASQLSRGFGPQEQLPRILYLFTSRRQDFFPLLADRPTAYAAPRGHPTLRNVSLGTAWHKPEAFIDFIQLSAEDFAA